jgi:TRAP-type C4-dicarboxylate transport system permease small subunit
MVWVVFLGSASIMRRWDHVGIPLLIQALPVRLRPPLIVFGKIATCVAVAIIAWYGTQVVMGTFHIRSQTSGINSRWIKLAVPIGAAAMAAFALRWVVHDIVLWRRGDLDYFRRYGELDLGPDADTAASVRTAAPGS